MKKLFLLLFWLSAASVSRAQLARTRWAGSILAPGDRPAVLQFTADSLKVFVAENNSLLEVMRYRLRQDTLLLTKLAGRSACDLDATGVYLWKLSGNNLSVIPVADACQSCFEAWPKTPFSRVAD